MPKLKCPKCTTEINLAALPPDRKVQCASCGTSFLIKPPAQSQAQKKAAAAAATGIEDPFALPGPDLSGLDLGSPATGSPAAPWATGATGAGAGGYAAPVAKAPTTGGSKMRSMKQKKSNGQRKKGALIFVIASTVVLLLACVIGAAVMMSGGGGSKATADRPKIHLPEGWKPVKFKGVYGILPNAENSRQLPGNFNGKVVTSPATNSLFLFGVMDAISGEVNEERVGKATRSLLGGDILPGGEIDVAGYRGFRGTYSVGVFLPDRCMIQMIPLEDRFILRGYLPYSAMVSNRGGDVTAIGNLDTEKEQQEWEHFSKALYVGPKPGFFSE
jgi:DNA-directed RNA polymerase subunit RPC12/RpoP